MANNRLRSIHSRVVKYAHSGLSALYKDLTISFRGYTKEQVTESREKYGENHIGKKSTDSIWFRLRRAFINPFSVVLFVLACVSLITDVVPITGYSKNFAACFIILGMLILSGTVRFVQEMRSKKAIDNFSKFIYTTVKIKRDGHWQEIPAEKLVVGDRISFHAGDRIPADVRLIRANDLFVSQSMLTGESEIFEKDTEILNSSKNTKISDYSNTVFAGSAVIGGTGEGIVLAVGKDTVYGDLGTISQGKNSGFDKGANSISWVLIRFMVVLVPLVFITCGITKGNWGSAFLFSLSVAVGLTPEMLPMVINACLAKGSAVMGKKNTIVKNINAMQGFGSMDVLCVDKTGTLTGDKIILEYYMDLLGNEDSRVLDFAYLNSYYHSGVQNHLDQAVLKVKEMPGKKEHFEKLNTMYPIADEQPFDYEKKFSGVLVEDGKENLFIIKGSVEEVFKRCSYVEYKGKIYDIDENSISSVNEIVDEMNDTEDLTTGIENLMNGSTSTLMLELSDDNSQSIPKTDVIKCGELSIYPKARKVIRASQEIPLTPKEFDILYFLARNRGEAFTKEQIYQAVWDSDYLLDDSNIMAFIRKLRKKIEPNPDAPEYIITIWGIGYKFNDKEII